MWETKEEQKKEGLKKERKESFSQRPNSIMEIIALSLAKTQGRKKKGLHTILTGEVDLQGT